MFGERLSMKCGAPGGVWRFGEVTRRGERHAEPATSSGIDRVADADMLQRALATLPPRVRAVVVLRVVEDLSEQQTAAALGCSGRDRQGIPVTRPRAVTGNTRRENERNADE